MARATLLLGYRLQAAGSCQAMDGHGSLATDEDKQRLRRQETASRTREKHKLGGGANERSRG